MTECAAVRKNGLDSCAGSEAFSLIEHFSGSGMHARAFREGGERAAEVDIIHGHGHDILKPSGMGHLDCAMLHIILTAS